MDDTSTATRHEPVPPLPPVPGVDDGELMPGGSSILDILLREHRTLLGLCDAVELADPAGATPEALEQVIVAEACRHLSTEAQYLYPAIRATSPAVGDMADLGLAEDVQLLVALQGLHRAGDAPAERRAAVIQVVALLRGHVRRTERRMVPALQRACTPAELVRLGNRAQIVREAAPTRPHPGLPTTPAVRKLVDPAVGAADKLVDLVTARHTRSQDL